MAVEGKVEQKIRIFIVTRDLQTRKHCQYLSLFFFNLKFTNIRAD